MSSLVKSVGTIGGLTLLSRIFGFARDMLLARVLGAGLAADAFQLAFTLPNTFRRLFAEGAFSVAFVPMYSRALHGSEGDGEAAAARFADDVLSVFLWTLLVFSGVMMAVMPGIVWVLARDFGSVPGKFELAVFLSRVTFPYLALISLVAMLSGLLNARSRFAPGAFAPVLLNIVLIGGIVTGWWLRGDSHDDRIVAIALAVSVSLAGVAQLAYLWWAVRRAGLRLHLRLPRLTPEVRRLGMLILPATFGAGIYQISQFVDTFFATSLPQGSLTLLKLADRLNQLPLGIVGIALGTAILPHISRFISQDNPGEAAKVQGQAVDLSMLLCLPAVAEACPNGLAPTTSTLLQLVVGDALAIALLEARGFTPEDFLGYHPGGKLGATLTHLAKVMRTGDDIPLVPLGTKMPEAVRTLAEKKVGCVCVVDGGGKLVGIITDGDLGRNLHRNLAETIVDEIMTKSPKTIEPSLMAGAAIGLINKHNIGALVVVENEMPVGLVHFHDLFRIGAA